MLFGYVTRSAGMAEAVLKITVKQKKKEDVKRSCGKTILKNGQGCTLPAHLSTAENRTRWNTIAAWSSMVSH